jgi:hypothetical protein
VVNVLRQFDFLLPTNRPFSGPPKSKKRLTYLCLSDKSVCHKMGIKRPMKKSHKANFNYQQRPLWSNCHLTYVYFTHTQGKEYGLR